MITIGNAIIWLDKKISLTVNAPINGRYTFYISTKGLMLCNGEFSSKDEMDRHIDKFKEHMSNVETKLHDAGDDGEGYINGFKAGCDYALKLGK